MENGLTEASNRAGDAHEARNLRLADIQYRLERVSTDPRLTARLHKAHGNISNRVVTLWLLAISALIVGLGLTLN